MLTLRPAVPADAETLERFVRELAEYEREPDAVVTDAAAIRAQLEADRPPFEAMVAELDGTPVGFALWFRNYSTWLGRPGLYLEDLYVTPAARGKGVGKALLKRLARIAVDSGCGRFEWSVLDWNTPAIEFYRALGAEPMDGWTVHRVTGEALSRLADGG
ncbi:MAG: GNAT family N-acetyltransferase [Planctomycetota bacterium JB042]